MVPISEHLIFASAAAAAPAAAAEARAGRRAAAVLVEVEVVQKVLAPLGVSGMIRAAAVAAGGDIFLLAKGTRAILYHFEAAGFI